MKLENAILGGNGVSFGLFGTGELILDSGGTLISGNVILASQKNATGSASRTGPGTTLDITGQLQVGRAGPAVMTVSDGAMIESDFGNVGSTETGQGEIVLEPLVGDYSVGHQYLLLIADELTLDGAVLPTQIGDLSVNVFQEGDQLLAEITDIGTLFNDRFETSL